MYTTGRRVKTRARNAGAQERRSAGAQERRSAGTAITEGQVHRRPGSGVVSPRYIAGVDIVFFSKTLQAVLVNARH